MILHHFAHCHQDYTEAMTSVLKMRRFLADQLRAEKNPTIKREMYWVLCTLCAGMGSDVPTMQELGVTPATESETPQIHLEGGAA